ncbi:hypothetical protein LZK98_11890 [Sphingomonas cannabina]|uniref:phage adaptor protein n=1 Tax=Sphingomonas cannabina TaxID=2899123 RepID=UPI001F2EB1E3|nr:hypothetical protein [Sphingomonas cannabina]UIJ43793.1 hypothetical protein LZK98_11890 [Sphingomonas cannabina]
MAILEAMQSAAVKLIGRKPGAFFGAAPGLVFEMEIADLVNEVAQDIAKSHDWQSLIRLQTLDGDGTQSSYDMPDDYDRMLVRSDVWDPDNWIQGYVHTVDINTFLITQEGAFAVLPGVWTIYANQMRFAPPLNNRAQFPYITKNWAKDASTTLPKAQFTADTDEFLLPERLLMLGLVWRWRENKKLDFTGDQDAFTKALGEYATRDRGSRVYRRSYYRVMPGTYPSWPWPLGV